jgi:hypothetical protein
MTSRLRRKRLTTARSIRSKRTKRASTRVGLAALLAALLAATPFAAALAGDRAVQTADYIDSVDQTEVTTVSYSTGEAGHTLTWLPYHADPRQQASRRASSQAAPASATPAPRLLPAERQAQFLAPAIAGPQQANDAAASTEAGTPLADPFGDEPRFSQVAPPEALMPDQSAAGPPAPMADVAPPAEAAPSADRMIQPQPMPETDMPTSPSTADQLLEQDQLPSMDDELAAAPGGLPPCPKPDEIQLKKIAEISYDISASKGNFPPECGIAEGDYQPRAWPQTTFTWTASGLCHRPLYFEDVQLERYGHSWGPYLQPIVSGAHFFLTVPLLPYKMGLYPPNECIYTLGYYRPGSCAPYLIDPLPLSVRAGLLQAGVWTGGAFLIP